MYAEVNVDPASSLGLGAFASTLATEPPPNLVQEERERLRTAARKVEALYPGAVGKHLRTDLESWASYGCFAFDSKGILAAAVAQILATPLPPSPAT